jgi:hypothetical protein
VEVQVRKDYDQKVDGKDDYSKFVNRNKIFEGRLGAVVLSFISKVIEVILHLIDLNHANPVPMSSNVIIPYLSHIFSVQDTIHISHSKVKAIVTQEYEYCNVEIHRKL